jgi:hypothetical protein
MSKRCRIIKKLIAEVEALDLSQFQVDASKIPAVDDMGYSRDVEADAENCRCRKWLSWIEYINRSLGTNIQIYAGQHTNQQIQLLLLSSLKYELLLQQEKPLFGWLTFDRALLLIATVGNLIISIIQIVKS